MERELVKVGRDELGRCLLCGGSGVLSTNSLEDLELAADTPRHAVRILEARAHVRRCPCTWEPTP